MKLKDHLNYEQIQDTLNAPIESFRSYGKVTETVDGIYVYKDIGASILAVAHLDSVNAHDHFYVNNFAGDDILFSTKVDDRLGAYIILHLLPRLGIHTDILLTEGEEVGKSTAKHFQTGKEYKWMFSFDRRGVDVVHYRYTNKPWVDLLTKHFGKATHGSVSDIDYLSHLKCCGLNIGTGYYDEHHLLAHANMSELVSQVGKFMQFYQTNKRIHYEYKPYVAPKATYAPPPPPTYTKLPPKEIPVSEEQEQEEDEYNPYAEMKVDLPLDILCYVDNQGVIVPPEKCAFCLMRLEPGDTHVFMGICVHCERWAVQCVECEEFFDRLTEPFEDMGDEERFYGLCPVCERRGSNENSGFSGYGYGGNEWDGDDDVDTGAETVSTG